MDAGAPRRQAGRSSGGGVLTWLGGLVSLSLLFGMAGWGYQIVMRDVSGVPVIRAPEGPMRISPADPGGRRADFLGLAVNAVAAEGTVARPADRLVLAPPPITLAAEDLPGAQLRRVIALRERARDMPESPTMFALPPGKGVESAEVASPVEPFDGSADGGLPPARGEEMQVETSAPGSADEAGDGQAGPGEARVAALVSADGEARSQFEGADPGEVAATGRGLRRSLRPLPRPEPELAADALAEAIARQLAGVDDIEVPLADLAPGTALVQLGAFASAETARQEWRALAARFADFFAEKRRVVQEAESGGKRFWRLRAEGFEDLSDARRFCAVLVAQGANCIPVVLR